MTAEDDTPPAALAPLLARFSLGAKHLVEPGPDAAALRWMTAAALRAPDHGGLVPWRLVAVAGAARERLARAFEAAAAEAGKDAESARLERERALQAPVTLTVVARIDAGHPIAPVHEQWAAIGGAIANLLNAAHALGYGGKMLSGGKVRSATLQRVFCGPGEQLVGWIVLGTPARAMRPRHDKPAPEQVLSLWPAAPAVPTPPADAGRTED